MTTARAAGALLLSVAACSAGADTPKNFGAKPHIIFLFCDNVGWANVGFHRDPPTPEVVTPNIDALAKSGVELDRHYTCKRALWSRLLS